MFRSTDTAHLSRDILGNLGVQRLSRPKPRKRRFAVYGYLETLGNVGQLKGNAWDVKQPKRFKGFAKDS